MKLDLRSINDNRPEPRPEKPPRRRAPVKEGSFAEKFLAFHRRPLGKFVMSALYTWLICGIAGLTLLYGPWDGFRTLLITTTEVTINHKYISHIFYPQATIDKVMEKNKVQELETKTDTGSISTKPVEKKTNEITLTDISSGNYKAWKLEISDPSTVFLGVSEYFGQKGQKMPYLISNYPRAVGGINAGGFGDANGFGNGGIAMGLVISEGDVMHMPNKNSYNIVGFNEDDVLILGKFTKAEVSELRLRDACEFTPFLIINGEPAEMSGNGGWGLNPRTAIGQRRDGTVVFVVVDGRSVSSAGVTIKTLQEIMIREDCYNAANLDGGSSTVLYYNGAVINNPSGSDSDGMRFLPNAFLVNRN